VRLDVPPAALVTNPAGESNPRVALQMEKSPGQWLEEARSEFRAEWHARVIRRKRRLSWALKGIDFTRATAERLAVIAVICAVGIWAAYRLPGAHFILVLAFSLEMVLACGLFLLALGLSILFEHLLAWLHERPVEHF